VVSGHIETYHTSICSETTTEDPDFSPHCGGDVKLEICVVYGESSAYSKRIDTSSNTPITST